LRFISLSRSAAARWATAARWAAASASAALARSAAAALSACSTLSLAFFFFSARRSSSSRWANVLPPTASTDTPDEVTTVPDSVDGWSRTREALVLVLRKLPPEQPCSAARAGGGAALGGGAMNRSTPTAAASLDLRSCSSRPMQSRC
jgi:hypothetical protein